MAVWKDIKTAPRDGRLIMIYVKPLGLAVPAMWGKCWKESENAQWKECWQLLHKDMWIGHQPGILGLPPDRHVLPSMWAEPPENIAHLTVQGADYRSRRH